MKEPAEELLEQGYLVMPSEDSAKLAMIRDRLFEQTSQWVAYRGEPAEEFFNHFHRYGLQGVALNDFRVSTIRYCSTQLNIARLVFEAFQPVLLRLIGPDIVVQKTMNLVIQQPGDSDQVPTHRDAPLNSPFEVVVWLPLVDVYGTKSMYILDRKGTEEALQFLRRDDPDFEGYTRYAEDHGINLRVPFGSACLFWTGLVHGCHVNGESETRWSFNIRYKNLFSPYGSKGLGDFFEPLCLSPLTQIAFEYEKGCPA
jgi:sporadic carbohydrate cluster 2OG-Fe(II) oxygenase